MKLPKTFVSDKDLEEKTQELTKEREPKKVEDVPKEIITPDDAAKYVANTIIPVYGYDAKKRIHSIDMTLQEAAKQRILIGYVDLLANNPLEYQGLYFNEDVYAEPSFDLKMSLDPVRLKYDLKKDSAKEFKEQIDKYKTFHWGLINMPKGSNFIEQHKKCTTIKVDTTKEILWVFDVFKDFKPIIHGGALRDLYLGIERTGDIDIEVKIEEGDEKKFYKLVHKSMDKVELSQKGFTEKTNGYMVREKRHHAQYRARKNGVIYDLAGTSVERFLSNEQIMMKNPGELIIHNLAKHDLDNKQFRLINDCDIPERIGNKILKLENMGLTYLPENPSNLSEKIEPYDILMQRQKQKSNKKDGHY